MDTPKVPESFWDAYEELEGLVECISRGEITPEALDEEADTYVREGCRDAAALARVAIFVYRYKLASQGFKEGYATVVQQVKTLEQIERPSGRPMTGVGKVRLRPGS